MACTTGTMNQLNCIYLNGGVSFHDTRTALCCHPAPHGGSPTIGPAGMSFSELLRAVAEARSAIRLALKRGEPCDCTDCPFTCHMQADPTYMFTALQFNQCMVCQLRCTYCHLTEANAFNGNNPDMLPLIQEMLRADAVAPGSLITLAGGEPTIMTNFEAIVDALHAMTLLVYSNGVQFSQTVASKLNQSSQLWVSLDCGDAALFAQLRGRPLFDQVVANLERYSQALGSRLFVKYILQEGNATVEQFAQFAALAAQRFPAAQLVVDKDHRYVARDYTHWIKAATWLWPTLQYNTHMFTPNEQKAMIYG